MTKSPENHCLTVTVEEAAELLGVSRTSAYEYVRTGKLPAVRLGRRLLIPKVVITALLETTLGSYV